MESIKILIPTDFSVQAEFAYLMVKKLAEKMNVEIHFAHVLAVPDTVYLDAKGNLQTCGEIDKGYLEKQKEIAERKLENLKTLYGHEIHTKFLLGKVSDSIVHFAKSIQADLIVTGTKGKWGLGEKLSASESQVLAQKSSVPVLSLMCDRSDLIIRNVLLVHNFNQPKIENLSLIHKIILSFDAKVHLLQIITGDKVVETHQCNINMQTWAQLNNISNYDCHVLSDLDIEAGVIHFNMMHEMDVVCIGTHGKGSFLHQTVTGKLINHLFKPIISFHLN